MESKKEYSIIKTLTLNPDTKKPYEIIIDNEEENNLIDRKIYVSNAGSRPSVSIKINNKPVTLTVFLLKYNPKKYICINKNNNIFDFRKENLKIMTRNEHLKITKAGRYLS